MINAPVEVAKNLKSAVESKHSQRARQYAIRATFKINQACNQAKQAAA